MGDPLASVLEAHGGLDAWASVDGLACPTHRIVHPRRADDTPDLDHTVITIDIHDVLVRRR